MNSRLLYSPRRKRSAAMLLLMSVTAGAVLAVPDSARAAETRDGPVMVGNKTNIGKITKEQATQNALTALPGTVTDVTVEKKRGKNVWVIEIVAEKTGAETDVLIDMDSGAVIGMDH
jgi:uncharacterized membrane protein YkoI